MVELESQGNADNCQPPGIARFKPRYWAETKRSSAGRNGRRAREDEATATLQRHFVKAETEQNHETQSARSPTHGPGCPIRAAAGRPDGDEAVEARAGFAIMVLVLIVAVGLIAAMFVTNTRYDGSSPVPVSER